MTIIAVILVLVIIGVIMWLVNTKIPMDSTIKTIINIVVLILIIIWLLKIFGVWGTVGSMKV